jgi:hypothetical protein
MINSSQAMRFSGSYREMAGGGFRMMNLPITDFIIREGPEPVVCYKYCGIILATKYCAKM